MEAIDGGFLEFGVLNVWQWCGGLGGMYVGVFCMMVSDEQVDAIDIYDNY